MTFYVSSLASPNARAKLGDYTELVWTASPLGDETRQTGYKPNSPLLLSGIALDYAPSGRL